MGIRWENESVVLAATRIFVTREDGSRIVETTGVELNMHNVYVPGSRVVSLDGEPFDAEITVIGAIDDDDLNDHGLGFEIDGEAIHIYYVRIAVVRDRETGRYELQIDWQAEPLSDRALAIILASVMPMPTVATKVDGRYVLGPPNWVDDDYHARWVAATQAALEGGAVQLPVTATA